MLEQSNIKNIEREKRSEHSIFKNCLDYEWKVNYNKTLIPLLKNDVLPYAQLCDWKCLYMNILETHLGFIKWI